MCGLNTVLPFLTSNIHCMPSFSCLVALFILPKYNAAAPVSCFSVTALGVNSELSFSVGLIFMPGLCLSGCH